MKRRYLKYLTAIVLSISVFSINYFTAHASLEGEVTLSNQDSLSSGTSISSDLPNAGEENVQSSNSQNSNSQNSIEITSDNTASDNLEHEISQNMTSANNAIQSISENISDNYISQNQLKPDRPTVSGSSPDINRDEYEVQSIILPTSVDFEMVLVGDGHEGIISSNGYEILNMGTQDVNIHIDAVCKAKNEDAYAVQAGSLDEEYMLGKKNVYMYLKIDKQDEVIEIPMGDRLMPASIDFTLYSIQEDLDKNKAYLSFGGELKSDMDEAWQEGDIEGELIFSFSAIEEGEG